MSGTAPGPADADALMREAIALHRGGDFDAAMERYATTLRSGQGEDGG